MSWLTLSDQNIFKDFTHAIIKVYLEKNES